MEDGSAGNAPTALRASSSARWRSSISCEIVVASWDSICSKIVSRVGSFVVVVVVDSKGL